MSDSNNTSSEQPRSPDQNAQPGHDSEAKTQDDSVSLLDLFVVLAKHWKLIFFSTFFAGAGILAFSFMTLRLPPDSPYNPLPNRYRPEAQILIQDSSGGINSALGNSDLGALAGLVGLSTGQSQYSAALAQALLVGDWIVSRIVDEFDLTTKFADAEYPQQAAESSVRGGLESRFDAPSGILTVDYEHTDPVFATDILRSVVGLLEERFKSLTRESARERTEAYQRQVDLLEDELSQARTALIAFQQRYGFIDPEIQATQTLETLATYHGQLAQLEIEKQGLLEVAESADDPQVRRKQREIDNLKRLISELQTGFRTFSPIGIPRDQIGPLTAQFYDLQQEVQLNQAILATFRSELIRANIESQDTTRNFQIIEPPEIPVTKAGPSRALICIVVTATVFFLSVFLSFIAEYFANAGKDPQESAKLNLIRAQFSRRR